VAEVPGQRAVSGMESPPRRAAGPVHAPGLAEGAGTGAVAAGASTGAGAGEGAGAVAEGNAGAGAGAGAGTALGCAVTAAGITVGTVAGRVSTGKSVRNSYLRVLVWPQVERRLTLTTGSSTIVDERMRTTALKAEVTFCTVTCTRLPSTRLSAWKDFGIETLAYGVVGLIQADVHQKIEWLTENHRTSGTSQRQGRAAKCRDQQGGSE
jgi:hypothetical protein